MNGNRMVRAGGRNTGESLVAGGLREDDLRGGDHRAGVPHPPVEPPWPPTRPARVRLKLPHERPEGARPLHAPIPPDALHPSTRAARPAFPPEGAMEALHSARATRAAIVPAAASEGRSGSVVAGTVRAHVGLEDLGHEGRDSRFLRAPVCSKLSPRIALRLPQLVSEAEHLAVCESNRHAVPFHVETLRALQPGRCGDVREQRRSRRDSCRSASSRRATL